MIHAIKLTADDLQKGDLILTMCGKYVRNSALFSGEVTYNDKDVTCEDCKRLIFYRFENKR